MGEGKEGWHPTMASNSSNKGKEKDLDPHTAHDSRKRALPALAMEQFCHSWGSRAHSQALRAQWLPPQGFKEFCAVGIFSSQWKISLKRVKMLSFDSSI